MTRTVFILISALLSASMLNGNGFNLSFTDVTKEAGLVDTIIYGGLDKKQYIIEANGCGIAFADFDNDGWTDLFVTYW